MGITVRQLVLNGAALDLDNGVNPHLISSW